VASQAQKSGQPRSQVILHPILCAIYPAIFLYTANKALFDFSVAVPPALVMAGVAGLVWFLLTRAMGDVKLAAVFTSMPFLALFSYGAVERATRSDSSETWAVIVCACVAIVCVAAIALLKFRQYADQVSYVFNIVSLLLVAAPAFQTVMWNIGAANARSLLPPVDQALEGDAEAKATGSSPDIYYLVLDGYGREDVLRTDYGLDNSPFLSELDKRGFYVAHEASSNYPFTTVSLTSTMNLTYLQDLFGDALGEYPDFRFMRERMQNSRATRMLHQAGYSIVSFPSEFPGAQIGSTDVEIRRWWLPNQFVIGLAQMTPLPSALSALGYAPLYDLHRYRTLQPFERIGEVLAMDGPKFVYSHIFYGHPPFVFGPNGERVGSSWDYTWDDGSRLLGDDNAERQAYIQGYSDQIRYLNGRLLETIDAIVAGSDSPPIIVIHGDHGPGSRLSTESLQNTDVRERYSIFYAALLPDGGAEGLYPTITPVNGMRVIFNRYFGADYPLLEDVRYYNPFKAPYQYTRVDDNGLRVAR
jgi:hypothetical protein